MQVFAGAAFYLYLPENILLATCTFLPNYCLFVLFVRLLVEAGFGCSLSVASNVFVITNRTFTCTASLANRRARRDRVGHPPPIPNCTNWLASCSATLHRKGGCPVNQLARSWLPSPPGGFLIFCVWLGAG
jgi:hypothetical protein